MFKKEVGKKMTENADTQSNNSESTEKMEGTEGNALVIVNVNVTCELSNSQHDPHSCCFSVLFEWVSDYVTF